ncbi:MAG TPA: hypothetical protein VHU83_08340 [Bryobacteraceae bacterium]|nr:hypothetical protein [Bryobacteraceae bacterium]
MPSRLSPSQLSRRKNVHQPEGARVAGRKRIGGARQQQRGKSEPGQMIRTDPYGHAPGDPYQQALFHIRGKGVVDAGCVYEIRCAHRRAPFEALAVSAFLVVGALSNMPGIHEIFFGEIFFDANCFRRRC